MSGRFLLDAAGLAVSLFTTLLLVWLGFMVLLNAERRTWGVLLAVGGLAAGAGFFTSHSIVLDQGADALIRGFRFWWQVGWAPLIAASYAWYLLMLWYNGYWDAPHSPLHRRQKPWLALSLAFTLLLGGLLAVSNPLPSIDPQAGFYGESLPSLAGLPVLLAAYPPYILLCIGLSLDALLRPAPSGRLMGDQARRRARPWLTAASLILLLVSLLVAGVILWLVQVSRREPTIGGLLANESTLLSILDLGLAALLMAAILCLGEAVVSYEIFTGKILPRRRFLTEWRSLQALAAGLSAWIAAGLTAPFPPILVILGVLLLVMAVLAIYSRGSFSEHEAGIRRLRPFLSSPRLFESILSLDEAGAAQVDLQAPFNALCAEILGAGQAVLAPLGPLAALGVTPLAYRAQDDPAAGTGPAAQPAPPLLAGIAAQLKSPETTGLPLDPQEHQGAVWAAPLWSERGLTGVLLLGPKKDGSVYSQEEVDLARASGERLADLLASAEIARRLAALQRQRLAGSGVLDRQLRRRLHDEVLPQLHTALLQLSACGPALGDEGQEILALLAGAHRQVSDLLRDLPAAPAGQVARLGLVQALRQVVDGELPEAFERVSWEVSPQAEQTARSLPALAAEVIYFAGREAIRNAARHGREGDAARRLHLAITAGGPPGFTLQVEDDGVGLPAGGEAPSGRAGGLALHSTLMAVISGSLSVSSAPGQYTRITLHLPEASIHLLAGEEGKPQ